ncbi:hypothetical protein AB0A71_41215 [Kitasatospora aureofaciens]|uniref:hypothetical protein n=1 Tax=Kitasatospora aureofaciens TaxID=1894 RepID=UPI0033C7118A
MSSASNRSMGDQMADAWKPPVKDAWCPYAKAQVNVLAFYKLTVTEAQRTAFGQMIDTCPDGS